MVKPDVPDGQTTSVGNVGFLFREPDVRRSREIRHLGESKMTVFNWHDPHRVDPDKLSKDEYSTTWAKPSPRCQFCDKHFDDGDKVMHWFIDGQRDIIAHAKRIAKNASGLMQDIARCLK